MASTAKYQVFISSTYEDLKNERDQVIRAVLEMGHIPVGMEMFSAADEEQWQIIARHIEQSDYYAVVVAHRLGSLTEDGISFTRKEYEYARELGIPSLGFLIDDKASWLPEHVETESGAKKALDEFKALIREKPVSFWSTAQGLHGAFSIALMKAFTASPREGWVRASSVAGPEVTAELTRLSSENAALRRLLTDEQKSSEKEHKDELRRTVSTMLATNRTPYYRYTPDGEWQTDADVTLYDVFLYLGPEMIVEASIEVMADALAMHIRKDTERDWDTVATNQLSELMADFLTLDLVQPSARKHPVSDGKEYWSLSATGTEALKMIRKQSLSEPKVDHKERTSAVEPEASDLDTVATPAARAKTR